MSNEHHPAGSAQPSDRFDDPTVEEIREIRRRQWQEAGRDVREYIRRARESAERIRSDSPPKPPRGR